MKKTQKTSLFIFRRDLRLHDNSGLIKALQESDSVITCFIFDERQVGTSNAYKSDHCLQFMLESLDDLAQQLKEKKGKLFLFHGIAEEVVKKLIKTEKIDAVYVNRDYTPFSIERDTAINNVCGAAKIEFISCADLLLNEPEAIKTGSGTAYAVFTAFYNRSRKEAVAQPQKIGNAHFAHHASAHEVTLHQMSKKIVPHSINAQAAAHGGRSAAVKILKKLTAYKQYTKERDFPALNATTGLSPHLKFGTVSVREVFYAIIDELGSHPLLRQLYWRDFFTHVAYHTPSVFGHAYHKKYDKLAWSSDKKHFKAWCDGETGFPIVDAGMRELNATGIMHNRVRMIAGSFLVKDLHLNWQWGEKYFAQKLTDYDPCVNNGNWQWVASTGCDAQPYFRIFNPWLQQKKFDPACDYIKKWVPELKKVSAQEIHALHKKWHPGLKYPQPIVEHDVESRKAKEYYKKA